MEKYVINGEEYDRKDVEFDSVEDPTVVVTDGVKEEADEPEEDQAYYGMDMSQFLNKFTSKGMCPHGPGHTLDDKHWTKISV